MKLSTLIGAGLIAYTGYSAGNAYHEIQRSITAQHQPVLQEASTLIKRVQQDPTNTTLQRQLRTAQSSTNYFEALTELDEASHNALEDIYAVVASSIVGALLLRSNVNHISTQEESYTRRRPSRSY